MATKSTTIHRTYTPLKYLLHAIQELAIRSKIWIQSPMLLSLEQEHQPNRRREELYRDSWLLEEEEEMKQPFHTNGKKELHEVRSNQGVFGLGEGGAARKKKQMRKSGSPSLYIAQGVRASGSTAEDLAVVPLPGGSTAGCSGSTAGVLAVVPLPLAVVPLPLETALKMS